MGKPSSSRKPPAREQVGLPLSLPEEPFARGKRPTRYARSAGLGVRGALDLALEARATIRGVGPPPIQPAISGRECLALRA